MRHTLCGLAALALSLLSPAARADHANDVVLGNGSAGPYALSWRGVAPGTETVQINTQPQTRGLDYALDAGSGAITFTRPLPAQSAALVGYDYDPAHAVHSGPALSLPLSLDLARTDRASLSLDALYKRSGGLSDADPGALSVGLGGAWQGPNAGLTTRLLFAPALSAPSAASAPDGLARTGLGLSGTADPSHAAHLTFGFSRVGVGLADIATDGLAPAGTQTLTFGSRLTPSRRVMATFGYTQTDPLAPNIPTTAQLAGALTITPSDALQLQTHWTQALTASGATDTGDLSLTAKPSATTQVSASFAAQDAPGTAGDTQTLNLAAQIAPNRTVSMNAAAGQSRQGAATTDHQEIALALSPQASFQLHTRLALNQTDRFATGAATFGGAFQPASFLQFTADYTTRLAPAADTAAQDTLDSSSAQLALSPVHGLRLTGRYAQNPDGGGGLQRLAQRGVGLETSLGALSLSGGYDWTRDYQTPTVGTTLNLGVGLRLSRALQLTGGYTQTLSGVGLTPSGTSRYTFGLTHNLGDRVSLSMNGTMQQPVGQTAAAVPDYRASADLGVKF